MALSMKLLYSLTHSCLHVSSRWWWFPLCWLWAGFGELAGMVGDMVRKAGRRQTSGWRSWEEWKGDGLCWEVAGSLWTGTGVTPMVSGPLWLLQEGSCRTLGAMLRAQLKSFCIHPGEVMALWLGRRWGCSSFRGHEREELRTNPRLSGGATGGFPGGSDSKESACNVGDPGSIPVSGRSPWGREWLPTPVFLPGEPHG